jgi:hypothetical protein
MVALASGVGRFFGDRNLGNQVPAALRARGWLIERHDDHFDDTTPDTTLLREIAARDRIFLTQDKRIRTRGPERRILLEHGVRTVSVASTANLSAADTIAVLISAETRIFDAITRETPPFILAVAKNGTVRRLDLHNPPPASTRRPVES